MDLRRLRYFVAVAEELSFSRAALRLGVTQLPLSKQIRDLEKELGVTLFERTKRHVRLTDAGSTLLEWSSRIFNSVEGAAEETRRASRGEVGRVSLAYVPAADVEILPRILRRFRARSHKVRVELHAMTTPEQLEALRSRQIDVGLVRLPAVASDLEVELIAREPLILAVSSGHALARSSEVPVRALNGLPFVLSRRVFTPTLHQVIERFLADVGIHLKVSLESVGVYDTLSMVAGGLGVSLLPACMGVVRRRGVVYRRISPRPPIVETGLAYRRDKPSEVRDSLIRVIHSLFRPRM